MQILSVFGEKNIFKCIILQSLNQQEMLKET